MKSFITGLLTILAVGIIGFITFRSTTNFMSKMFGSPTPSASSSPTASPVATPSPTPTIELENGNTVVPNTPTTKGGMPIVDSKVKGASTYVPSKKTVTTTTTTSHLTLTLIKSSVCPVSYVTEVKDITGPLTLRYELIKDTSFGITVWNSKGEELVQNTTYSGSFGAIKTISGVDYMKVRVESKSCAGNNDNWIKLTAER